MSLGKCKRCRRPIRWARTVNGKMQALDPITNSDRGTVKLQAGRATTLSGEVLAIARSFDDPLFVPHAATCAPRR